MGVGAFVPPYGENHYTEGQPIPSDRRIGKMTDKRRQRIAVSRPSDVELQNEYNYILAENFTKKLLEMGFVSEGEFNKIMAKNRESFSPFFARI